MSASTSVPSKPVGNHAIVYGGSLAGLISASVLASHFERVTLVERDRLEEGSKQRKGVPQAQHYHGLLSRGINILGSIFPGIGEDLKAGGAQELDMCRDLAWFMGKSWRPRFRSNIPLYSQSRPLLEWTVRRRLLALPNVRLLDGREVTGFAMSGDNTRVTGVRLQAPGGGQEETLEGALVVDASGRGSRTPQWLETLGFSRVEETRIQVDVGYASLLFRLPPDIKPGWKMLSIAPDLPRTRRFGVVASIEEDRFLASVGGWLGEHPPTDEAGFLEFARSLSRPHLYEVLRLAEPLAPISPYRFPYHQRRHYERLSRFPEGLAVVGDAVCSFNPTYGQGITTGALQAEMLGKCLRQGLEGATQRYRRQLGELLGVPWAMATTGDLRFPEVEGARPPGFALTNWYGDRLQQLAGYDQDAMKAFVRVIHMLDSPAAMFSPLLALKVLTARPDAAVPSPGPEPLTPSRSQAA